MNLAPVIAAAAGAARPPDSPPVVAGPATGRASGASPTAASGPSTVPGGARAAPLSELVRGLSTAAGQRNAERLGGLLSTFVRGSLSASARATTTTGATGSLAFLKDPRLSVEEKLARLMIQLSDKYERQLEEKLRQFADLESGKATPAASTAKKGAAGVGGVAGALGDGITALLGKAVGGASSGGTSSLAGALLPKLATQLTGPVLAGAATALGMPAIAPALLKAGPAIGGVVASLAGAASPKPKATGTPASTTPAPSEKQLMTEIQILQEKQREMFTLVSNILRSQHDTKMAVLGNIR